MTVCNMGSQNVTDSNDTCTLRIRSLASSCGLLLALTILWRPLRPFAPQPLLFGVLQMRSLADDSVRGLPLARWGTALDIGEAVAFLCSPRGALITGAALPVDGGRHLVGTMIPASRHATSADALADALAK